MAIFTVAMWAIFAVRTMPVALRVVNVVVNLDCVVLRESYVVQVDSSAINLACRNVRKQMLVVTTKIFQGGILFQ